MWVVRSRPLLTRPGPAPAGAAAVTPRRGGRHADRPPPHPPDHPDEQNPRRWRVRQLLIPSHVRHTSHAFSPARCRRWPVAGGKPTEGAEMDKLTLVAPIAALLVAVPVVTAW